MQVLQPPDKLGSDGWSTNVPDEMAKIILLNKPFRVLSQFSDKEGAPGQSRETLADYLAAPNFRVAGRLDYDSEGLLLLTDDGLLQQQIANPRHKQWKTYLVQVEGEPNDGALRKLIDGDFVTLSRDLNMLVAHNVLLCCWVVGIRAGMVCRPV